MMSIPGSIPDDMRLGTWDDFLYPLVPGEGKRRRKNIIYKEVTATNDLSGMKLFDDETDAESFSYRMKKKEIYVYKEGDQKTQDPVVK